jgi:AcrR family transcriptional regulator
VRQERILDAATAAFATTPYADVRVVDVAEQAGSSPALVFRYFESKAGLYVAVVERSADELRARQAETDAALPDGVPVRDRVRADLEVYLDHLAVRPSVWVNALVAGAEPAEALRVRARLRGEQVDRLRALLRPATWSRHEFALHGYFGFVDRAALAWVAAACPADDRYPLVDAALGALQGALGDWGR